jgi:hypothetical protein
MSEPGNIEHQKTFTNAQVIRIVIATILITFTLTGIFFRFLELEKDMKSMQTIHDLETQVLKDKIDYVNERLSRKIGKDEPTD